MILLMVTMGRKERANFIQDFASRLKFPYLFFLLAILFLVDLFIPDPIPFIDEAILGILAVLFASWKGRKEALPDPPEKNITPPR